MNLTDLLRGAGMAEPHENTPELPQLSKSQAQNPGPGLRTTTEWHCSLSLGLKAGSSGEAKPSLGDSGRPGRTRARVPGGTPRTPAPRSASRPHQSPGHRDERGDPGPGSRPPAARPPGASLLTRTTIPRIQLGEHRAEINGAEAALHGEGTRRYRSPLSC